MLQGQLSEQSQQLSEQSQRHDTIMLKMTNAIENQQLQLQEVQNQQSVGFWKRIFGMPQDMSDNRNALGSKNILAV